MSSRDSSRDFSRRRTHPMKRVKDLEPGDILSGGWEITSYPTYSQPHKLWMCKAKPADSLTERLLEWDDGERKLVMM